MNTTAWFELGLLTALKGSILLLLTWGVTLLLPRASAAFRHFVWTAGIVALLALPVLGSLLPAWPVVAAPRWLERNDAAPRVDRWEPDAGSGTNEPYKGTDLPVATLDAQEAHGAPRLDDGVPGTPLVAAIPSVPAAFLIVWGAGICIAGGLLALQHARVRRLAARTPEHDDPRILDLVRSVARSLGLARNIRVLEGSETAVPMTWGTLRPALLLPASARTWDRARLRDVLVHELAHLRRRDPVIQHLSQIARALYWWNPLTWVAVRRLGVEREIACDDAVLAAGANAADYAETLLSVVQSARAPLAPAAAIALGRSPQLPGRLYALLDDSRRRGPAGRRGRAVAAGLAALCLTSVAAVELGAALPKNEVDTTQGALVVTTEKGEIHLDENSFGSIDGTWIGNWNEDGYRAKLKARGKITFNEDFTDVTGISSGGYFKVEENNRGDKRRLELTPNGTTGLARRYWRDGEEAAFDGEAARWFAGFLPEWFRRSGAYAGERVAWILERHGVTGVLEEIALISSDYVSRLYFEALLEQAEPALVDLEQVLLLARERIGSDYEMATLLIEVSESRKLDEPSQIAFVGAIETLESDYESRRAMTAIVETQPIGGPVLQSLLTAAAHLDSDYEQAEFLILALDRFGVQPDVQGELFAAVATIGSDYERRRVLSDVLAKDAPSRTATVQVLEAADGIDSDYEQAELLIEVAEHPIGTDLEEPFFRALEGIDSDYEQGRVLTAVVSGGDLAPETLLAVLRAARAMGSGYELAQLLVSIAATYPLEGKLREAYIAAAEAISAGHEADRALAALARNEGAR